jgi:hypothetical protein
MRINWDTRTKLYIAPSTTRQTSPDLEASLRVCVTMAKAWPSEVVYELHTDEPVLEKTVLVPADVARLPSPN